MAESRPIKFAINPQAVKDGTQYYTICEVHRKMWRFVEQAVKPEDPVSALKIQAMIAEAYDLGKRMSQRLKEYHDARREGKEPKGEHLECE